MINLFQKDFFRELYMDFDYVKGACACYGQELSDFGGQAPGVGTAKERLYFCPS